MTWMDKMSLIAEAPANTLNYMIAGYAVIFGVIFLYLISLYVRRRNFKQDIQVLESLQRQKKE